MEVFPAMYCNPICCCDVHNGYHLTYLFICLSIFIYLFIYLFIESNCTSYYICQNRSFYSTLTLYLVLQKYFFSITSPSICQPYLPILKYLSKYLHYQIMNTFTGFLIILCEQLTTIFVTLYIVFEYY